MPFKANHEPAFFFNQDGLQKPMDFMTGTGNFEFYRDEKFQAVNLPFATGRFSLYVFVPSEKSSLKEFFSRINEETLKSWLDSFLERPGEVLIPQFKIESDWDLRPALKSLGMDGAFSEKADFRQAFTNLSGRNYFGSVEQEAAIEIDDKTVSSPLTQLNEGADAANTERFSLKINRPFFFLLRDNKTSAWLALGAAAEF